MDFIPLASSIESTIQEAKFEKKKRNGLRSIRENKEREGNIQVTYKEGQGSRSKKMKEA